MSENLFLSQQEDSACEGVVGIAHRGILIAYVVSVCGLGAWFAIVGAIPAFIDVVAFEDELSFSCVDDEVE